MKNYKLYFLLLLSIFCLSCGGDDDPDPNSGSDCASEVTFLEDNVSTTLPIGGLGSGEKAVFQLKDPSPFNPQGVSRAFGLRMQSGTTFFDIVLELNVDDSESCLPLGSYSSETLNGSDGVISFLYMKSLESYVVALGEGTGVLEITECDFENKTISGTFNCTMVKPFTGESIEISNGTFEDVCFVE